MHCYHHTDADGLAAGYIVKNICDGLNIHYTTKDFSCVDYNSVFNDHDDMEDIIFIVDLSFTDKTVDNLIRICNHSKKVIWVDHHQSSRDLFESKKFKDEILGKYNNLFIFFSENGCGALNTYRLVHKLGDNDKIPFVFYQALKAETTSNIFILSDLTLDERFNIPLWLSYIDDYDRWIHKLPGTKKFQLGLMARENHLVIADKETGHNMFNPFWDELSKPDCNLVNKCVNDGNAIKMATDTRYRKELNKAFQVRLEDGSIILCKNAFGNSENFLNEINNYDAVSIFHYDGRSGKWYHSIYSYKESNFDCAKFAEQFGGGGHFHAAGFNVNEPIWVTKYNKKNI